MLNNINIAGLSEYANEVKEQNIQGKASYGINLNWESGTKTTVSTKNMILGEHKLIRDFNFTIDEPTQLLGVNSAPNPAEYMLGGMAGCMAVTFMAGATAMNIEINQLQLEIDGELDLQGFLGLNPEINPGFPELKFIFHVQGNGTQEQYERLIERVIMHSPNYNTIKNKVKLIGELKS
ncbi:OsmC family protein [Psychroserpens jangbogonensis]|uniref:OsmC family protein n=1 Tax=Psychroserpens jangbogonensis TaxID=1484460 RepID=UPI00053D15B1|nr:OsmC family protein [Psychroserpens jangbogonensis]